MTKLWSTSLVCHFFFFSYLFNYSRAKSFRCTPLIYFARSIDTALTISIRARVWLARSSMALPSNYTSLSLANTVSRRACFLTYRSNLVNLCTCRGTKLPVSLKYFGDRQARINNFKEISKLNATRWDCVRTKIQKFRRIIQKSRNSLFVSFSRNTLEDERHYDSRNQYLRFSRCVKY